MSKKKKNKLRNQYKKRRKNREAIQQHNESQFQKVLRQFKNLREEILRDRGCNHCGTCCNTFKIKLTQKDINKEPKLAEHATPMSKNEIKRYKTKDNKEYVGRLETIGNNRCVFYDEEVGCKIHSTKPAECVAYIPSLCHCKGTELHDYFSLKEYINMHQKICMEGIKNCTEKEKIERFIKVTDAYILLFISTFHKMSGEQIFMEPEYEKPIPKFIKDCLELDGSYQLIKDLPIAKSYYEQYRKNLKELRQERDLP